MAPEVRLNGPENEPLGIVSLMEALRMAGELDVDLVEIAATAVPPVCRLMDYGKFKYQEQKKAAEAKAKQTVIEIKEIKFRPGTDDGDYNIKMRNIRRFLDDGGPRLRPKGRVPKKGCKAFHKSGSGPTSPRKVRGASRAQMKKEHEDAQNEDQEQREEAIPRSSRWHRQARSSLQTSHPDQEVHQDQAPPAWSSDCP